MPKHTSSPQRMMLTNITGLVKQAEKCAYAPRIHDCPLMGVLLAIEKSLQIEVKNLGENDRDQRP